MYGPTKRQEEVFEFICEYQREWGKSPSVREICDYMGMASPNGCKSHLDGLERKGYIKRRRGQYRSIEVLK